GIRLPDLTVPLAKHTGWHLRRQEVGNLGLLIGVTGGLAGWTLPLPARRVFREGTRAPRGAIDGRGRSRGDYLHQVAVAVRTLGDRGYLLAEDISWVEKGAAQRYDLWCE